MRAREATSSARLSVLAIAVAASSVKSAMRCSVPPGNGPRRDKATIAPQRRPLTWMGLATAERSPSRRA